ncbi:MAG: aminotransferase class V-fold PLP-dependent enzyme [Lachnospiraceae bacterium]|nr:aminotransferase class V-fold PLP-dependent enzyme [Lachnospiraceae bacterium]
MIYLDNAATSGKKPESVYRAVDHALRNCSGNPGRSGHAVSLAAGKIVSDARLQCARLFGAADPSEISFGSNTTMALNTAIYGIARTGMHIITSTLEHNSVARPLEHLRNLGLEVTILPASLDSGVDPDELKKALRKETGLIVMTHISNVTGTVNDIAALGAVAREAGIPFLVDAAQSAGTRSIDVQRDQIDMLAFPGHKSLLGPQGTGGLYIRSSLSVEPLTRGGTGSFSELPEQPERMPDRLESGTLNVPGLAGLAEGIRFILETGVDEIEKKERALRACVFEGLSGIPGVTLYTPSAGHDAGNVLSFTMDGIDSAEVSAILDSAFGIAVRSGLHCAPYTHRMLGTIHTGGTIRVSPGYFNEMTDAESFVEAIRTIQQENA